MNTRESNRTVSFVIDEHIGIIARNQSGWTKELNLVSWNGNPAKLDLRDWSPDKSHMGKGITLFREEGEALQRLLYRYFRDTAKQPRMVVQVDQVPAAMVESPAVEGHLPVAETMATEPSAVEGSKVVEPSGPEDPDLPF